MSYSNFMATQQDPTPAQQRNNRILARKRREIGALIERATKIHGCNFDKGFIKRMLQYADLYKEIPSVRMIDALVAEWHLWEPYVTPESFKTFMEDGIETILKIDTTSTFRSQNLKGYIGNKATVIKELPRNMVTTVYQSGKLTLNRIPVKVPVPFAG